MITKREVIVDKREVRINDDLSIQPVAYKGRVVKVIELSDMDKTFLSHRFNPETLKILFWSQFELDYIGG